MTLSEELLWRGLVKDHTFEDIQWLDEPKTFYLGADAGAADSLTAGNLKIFMLARRLTEAGWKAVLLMGGATSMVGDPGGRTTERELVSKDLIDRNITGIRAQVEKLFGANDFTLVNNYDWFKDIGYLDFLRDVGKHYSMTELLQRDFVADRIGEGGTGISYAEFSYSLVQGFDYWHLYKHHNVILQIGGSDQWGNMLSGVPLIRKREGVDVHALSTPLLIDKSTGRKFGKSEDGAIWLDEKKTSPYKFYQFWLNCGDLDVIDYLKELTLLPCEKIQELEEEMKDDPSGRTAQKALAYELTKLVHGAERADAVLRVTDVLFGLREYSALTSSDFDELKTEQPIAKARLSETLIVDVMVETHLAESKSEARRFLDSNAVYINGSQFSLEKSVFEPEDSLHGFCVLRRGKNTSALVVLHQYYETSINEHRATRR